MAEIAPFDLTRVSFETLLLNCSRRLERNCKPRKLKLSAVCNFKERQNDASFCKILSFFLNFLVKIATFRIHYICAEFEKFLNSARRLCEKDLCCDFLDDLFCVRFLKLYRR